MCEIHYFLQTIAMFVLTHEDIETIPVLRYMKKRILEMQNKGMSYVERSLRADRGIDWNILASLERRGNDGNLRNYWERYLIKQLAPDGCFKRMFSGGIRSESIAIPVITDQDIETLPVLQYMKKRILELQGRTLECVEQNLRADGAIDWKNLEQLERKCNNGKLRDYWQRSLIKELAPEGCFQHGGDRKSTALHAEKRPIVVTHPAKQATRAMSDGDVDAICHSSTNQPVGTDNTAGVKIMNIVINPLVDNIPGTGSDVNKAYLILKKCIAKLETTWTGTFYEFVERLKKDSLIPWPLIKKHQWRNRENGTRGYRKDHELKLPRHWMYYLIRSLVPKGRFTLGGDRKSVAAIGRKQKADMAHEAELYHDVAVPIGVYPATRDQSLPSTNMPPVISLTRRQMEDEMVLNRRFI